VGAVRRQARARRADAPLLSDTINRHRSQSIEIRPARTSVGGFVAGQIGIDPHGSILALPNSSFVDAFERLKQILEEASCEMSDLVDLVSYHVALGTHLAEYAKDRSYVTEAFRPAPRDRARSSQSRRLWRQRTERGTYGRVEVRPGILVPARQLTSLSPR
jgi:enamine deaminase RidA (YjgF/YER057c/UK114 family)